jgi:hypothetical protein
MTTTKVMENGMHDLYPLVTLLSMVMDRCGGSVSSSYMN